MDISQEKKHQFNNQTFIQAVALLILTNFFFAFQFIPRLSLGILREEVITKFNLDTATYGILSGYYYIGYSLSLIPIGIMLDKFSFRVIMSSSVAICALGMMTFIFADNWTYLALGRFIIGAGSGCAFLSVVKVIKTYFQDKHQAVLIGFSFSFGLLGAVFGVTPMKLLFNNFGYNYTFNILIITTLIIAALMLIFGNVKSEIAADEEEVTLSRILQLMLNPIVLIMGVSGGLMVGSFEGFADAWAMPFFMQVFDFTEIDSNMITSCVYFGMCVGGPILAIIANMVGSIHIMIFIIGILNTLVFILLFYVPSISFNVAVLMMFILGILCCYQSLVFTSISKYVAKELTGLAIAFTNCINMSFGYLFHVFIASELQQHWNGATGKLGEAIYMKATYVYALSSIPVGSIIGTFGFLSIAFYMHKKNQTSQAQSAAL